MSERYNDNGRRGGYPQGNGGGWKRGGGNHRGHQDGRGGSGGWARGGGASRDGFRQDDSRSSWRGERSQSRSGGFRRDGDERRGGFGDRQGQGRWRRDEHRGNFGSRRDDRGGRNQDQLKRKRDHEPRLPDNVKASDLDRDTLRALEALNEDNAEKVARHLVMVGSLLDIDAEAAYGHAQAAVSRAGRIGEVREAAALAAYACGKYTEALQEVRAARRISGSDLLRAVEADCARGLGRPERALEIIAETDTAQLDQGEQAELVIVASGARADMEQYEAGLLLIEDFLARSEVEDEEILARLLSVKADRLEQLGREDEAAEVRESAPVLPDLVSIVDLEEVAAADTVYVASDLHGSRKPLLETFDTLLLDLDGVCYRGDQAIENAAQGVAQARAASVACAFVTNNASRSPAAVCEQLASVGIEAEPGEIMTAAIDAVGLLTDSLPPGAKVLVVGGEGLHEAVERAGFAVVTSAEDKPAAVIQGYDRSVDWGKMSEAAYAIAAGAMFVATNMDASLPTERGLALGNGALVAAVSHATGVQPRAGGKPYPSIYRRALALGGGKRPLAVGDRLDTDMAGAKAAGYRCLHLLTGVSQPRDVALAPPEYRPDFVGVDLRAVSLPHPGVVKNPTREWTSGDSAGFRVDKDGTVYRDDQALAGAVTLCVADYRAFLAAVWEARDNGTFVELPETLIVVQDSAEAQAASAPVAADEPVQQQAAAEADGASEAADAPADALVEADDADEHIDDDVEAEVSQILADAGIVAESAEASASGDGQAPQPRIEDEEGEGD